MKTSESGIALIKRFEGLELESYQDSAGVWTIGYGHTETAGPNQQITAREAEELLKRDLKPREQAVDNITKVPLNQNEFDALVSFVYNVGITAYQGSTARRRLNAGDRIGAAEALTWWNKATVNGVLREVTGLTRRRAAERALFLTPVNPPIVNDAENLAESSRVTPIEDTPRRDGLGESRTIQGATVAGGAGALASTMGREDAKELDQLETNIQNGSSMTEDPNGLGERDTDVGDSDVGNVGDTGDAAGANTGAGGATDPGTTGETETGETETGETASDGTAGDASTEGDETAVAINEGDAAEGVGEGSFTDETLSDDAVSDDMNGQVIQPIDFPNPAKHEKHAADAQVQLALLIIMVLAILYIIFARIDDWLKYRR